jgi:hypothetical protein
MCCPYLEELSCSCLMKSLRGVGKGMLMKQAGMQWLAEQLVHPPHQT